MRTDRPDPGNPWPHDMVLTIEEDTDEIVELLWIRERFRLDPVDTAPPTDVLALPDLPLTPEALRRDKRRWNRGWSELWASTLRRWSHEPGPPVDPSALDDEQVRLLVAGPSWRTRFGDAPFDADYDAWREALRHRRTDGYRRGLDQQPERRSLPALVEAWHRGLTTVVTVPVRGDYARTLGAETLLVAEGMREDPLRYGAALGGFDPLL